MPVKKTKTKKRAVGSKAKNQIKEMVDALPGLIAEDLRIRRESESAEHRYSYSQSAYDPYKKRLVFLGVGGVMVAILLLWGISIKTRIYDTRNSSSVEGSLITEAKLGLGSVLVDLEASDDGTIDEAITASPPKESAEETQARNNLQQNLAMILVSMVSSTTSTPQTSTTSPELPE